MRNCPPHVTALCTGHKLRTDSCGVRCSWNERAKKEERALDEFAAKLASLVSVSPTDSIHAIHPERLDEAWGPGREPKHGNGERNQVADTLGALPRFDLDSLLPSSGDVGDKGEKGEERAGVTQGADVASESKAKESSVRERIVGMMEYSDEELMRKCCTRSVALILPM